MKKKILFSMLTLILCFTAAFSMFGCEEKRVGTLTVTTGATAVQFNEGVDRDVALKDFKFTYVPYTGEFTTVWNKEEQKYEKKEMVASDYENLTYAAAVKLGLSVTGFSTKYPTAEGETNTMVFTLFGASFEVTYTVKAKA